MYYTGTDVLTADAARAASIVFKVDQGIPIYGAGSD
jgi:hypothetical protein